MNVLSRPTTNLPINQRGAVLYVALVFLVLLALLGVAGMQVAMMQERMSSNYRTTNIAFQNAEAEARTKELEIENAFRDQGSFVSDQERCDPAFDPGDWAQDLAVDDDSENIARSRRIDECTAGFSIGGGVRPLNEKTDQMYQVSSFAHDDEANPNSNAAIDTIFIP